MLYHYIGFIQPQVLTGSIPFGIRFRINPQDIVALLQLVILVLRVDRKHCIRHRLAVLIYFVYPCRSSFLFILGLDFHQCLFFT